MRAPSGKAPEDGRTPRRWRAAGASSDRNAPASIEPECRITSPAPAPREVSECPCAPALWVKSRSGNHALASTPALFSVVFFCLTACTVGPNYQRPAALAGTNSLPGAFSGVESTNGVKWKPAQPGAHFSRGPWWQVFADPELDRLEKLGSTNNQQLAAAMARFEQARASVNIARADLFPQIELDPAYTRQRTSANEPQNGRAAGIAPTFNTFTMSLQAGWEADLWGRVHRQVESARAQLAASADDLESVRLAIQSELAIDYFTLRALDSEYDLLLRTAETYRRSLELTVNRRKGGVASDLDVSEAETQLRGTEALLPALRLQRLNLLHAMAVLCGEAATGFNVPAAAAPPVAPPIIPVWLPSELLERRPDIASAERRMAAANAEVGVAQSAFYPVVRFNGLAGFESLDAASWFDWPSRFWAVGPTVQLPLFTGGRNRAQLQLAHGRYTESIANYRQTVLGAFQEVEDQLAAQTLLASQLERQESALQAAHHTLEIANNRYKAGLVTYLEVAVAQSAALSIERNVVQLRGDKLVATVGLIRALGGGWDPTEAGS